MKQTGGFAMNYDAVFHCDNDGASLKIALTNITNLFKALETDSFTAVLLVNGPGIKLMARDNEEFAGEIRRIKELGAVIRVCRNAMNHFGLTPEQICPECDIVPAGVIELIDLQRKGYAYIKP
jgi:intracellular sulfur oxidation DsrE/DsrF family protein